MSLALVVGLVGGVALVLTLSVLIPSRPPLGVVLDRLHRPRQPAPSPEASGSSVPRRLTQAMEGSGTASALSRSVGADLRLLGMSETEYAVRRVVWPVAGALVAPGLAAFAFSLGIAVPVILVIVTSLALAVLGAMVPVVTVRSRARARRDDFTYALSGFVDLVAIALAGGLGVEEALVTCADTGQGWAFGELRRALAQAQLRNEAPWEAFTRLATELGVPELAELAASVTLAGKDGARVTTSITAKAKAMRAHAQARVEAAGHSASELMSVPLMLLLGGLVIFIAFPAAQSILSGLRS
jgi:tight adherence protein C